MRASFRSFSSSILVSLGTGALLVLIVVAVTGGFSIRAGFFRFSAHSLAAAGVVSAAAWLLAIALDRPNTARAAARIPAFVAGHGAAIAIVAAAAAAGNSIGFGGYTASGADAAGYMSQATLLGAGRVARIEPLALQAGWPEAESSFSPLGYRPGLHPGEIVPTYPPGLPLTFAAAQRAFGEFGPYIAISLLAAATVLATFAIASMLHSGLAGPIAAVLMATSPIFIVQSLVPMSDVPATAWWALALACALGTWRGGAIAAGLLTGLAVLTRPNLSPFALVVAAALLRHRDRRARRLIGFVLGGVPAALTLLGIQWRIFGTPFASGHGSFSYLFSLDNVLPNLRDYTIRLLLAEWPALLLTAIAAALTWRRGSASGPSPDSDPGPGTSPGTRPGTSPGADPGTDDDVAAASAASDAPAFAATVPPASNAIRVASLAAAAILLCYLPYGVFPDWTYLRFFLPAFPALFAATAALVVIATTRLPVSLRGLALLVAVTIVCSLNVATARRLQAFELRLNEGRYETTGRYLAAALPANAVVVTVQESASAWYYTGLPVLRWDLLDVDLDAALARLRTLGKHPVLLVEDWEAADLSRRFPASATAQLDWRPRADIGDPVRVRLFDPEDRLIPRADWAIDRLHVE